MLDVLDWVKKRIDDTAALQKARPARTDAPSDPRSPDPLTALADLTGRLKAAGANRFIDGFYDLITLIFHYHYQWNKRDERQRNEVAIREHLTYIEALFSRNASIVDLLAGPIWSQPDKH